MISKNNINQFHYYNTDSRNNLSIYKKEKSITDKIPSSKDNYINLSLDPTSKKESVIKSRKVYVINHHKPVIQRREEETKQNTENENVTVKAKVINKKKCNNKVSNEIQRSAYKETESITYESNVGNNNYDGFGSEPIFKAESYINASKCDENNQDKR